MPGADSFATGAAAQPRAADDKQPVFFDDELPDFDNYLPDALDSSSEPDQEASVTLSCRKAWRSSRAHLWQALFDLHEDLFYAALRPKQSISKPCKCAASAQRQRIVHCASFTGVTSREITLCARHLPASLLASRLFPATQAFSFDLLSMLHHLSITGGTSVLHFTAAMAGVHADQEQDARRVEKVSSAKHLPLSQLTVSP